MLSLVATEINEERKITDLILERVKENLQENDGTRPRVTGCQSSRKQPLQIVPGERETPGGIL